MELLTNLRDEMLKRLVDGISALMAGVKTKLEEENLQRYSQIMIHVRELLPKLQSQPGTTSSQTVSLLQRLDIEVSKAQKAIDDNKSTTSIFRPIQYKLKKSFTEIDRLLHLLQIAEIKTNINIKTSFDPLIHGMESVNLNRTDNSDAILSKIDAFTSQDSRNKQYIAQTISTIAKAIGVASNSVSPLPETETALPFPRTSIDEIASPPSSFFFCSLTCELLKDPVTLSCNHDFERRAIEEYFHSGHNLCPLCNKELSSTGQLELTPNHTLRSSVSEWRTRNAQINAEREAKRKLRDAASRITLDDNESTNRALEDLQALMREMPSCISEATEGSCKLVPKLAELLKNGSANIATVLRCLFLIVCFSDLSKEEIGKRGVIQCLLKQSTTEPDAVAILLELSKIKMVAEKIGGIKSSIPIFVSLLDNRSSGLAEMARAILENLSAADIKFTIMMAKSGYFEPFLNHWNTQGISEEERASMAEELAQMPLTETAARNLENERFIGSLTEMLGSSFPSSKMASFKCIKRLMDFHWLRNCLLSNECAILSLLHLVRDSATDQGWKQEALEILFSLVEISRPSECRRNPGLQMLCSSNSIQCLLEQIKPSTPEVQASVLQLLMIMVQKFDVARECIFVDHNDLSCLFSLLKGNQNSKVKLNALKLIYYIAGDHPIGVLLPTSPAKESIVGSIIAILTESCISEEISAAASIIALLPTSDRTIDEMLQSRGGVLKCLHGLISHASSHNLLENALWALLRCISQSRVEFLMQVSKLLRADLVHILSAGSALAKQRAATILAHLARFTVSSLTSASSSPQFPKLRKSVKEGYTCGCPVHSSIFNNKRVICLVENEAVRPLVEMVKIVESGASEAALMALNTLFDAGCDFDAAAHAIVDSRGAEPILEVLQKGPLPVKEMALELFGKISRNPGITEAELETFKGILFHLVCQDGLSHKANLLLKDLI